jgi:predicted RNA-binding Zn ribbon-like protein
MTQQFDTEFTPQLPWLDLINSQHWDGFGQLTDHLLDAGWVAEFLGYWKTRPKELGRASPYEQTAELRELLRQTTEKVVSGIPLSRGDIRALNAFLKAPGYRQLATRKGQISNELRPVTRNWAWFRSQIASSFVDSILDQPARLKICGNPLCQWAFFDRTKSNNRRWCKDRRCGNRDRVRRSRARAVE